MTSFQLTLVSLLLVTGILSWRALKVLVKAYLAKEDAPPGAYLDYGAYYTAFLINLVVLLRTDLPFV